MMRHGRLAAAAIALLVVGVILMIALDTTITRILGVVALAAWIVVGTFAIARPESLDRED
jgi:hypothetical protein